MNFRPASSNLISDFDRTKALTYFGLNPTDLFAKGSEAEVYSLNETTLLKLYSGIHQQRKLEQLQLFLDSIDRSALPFSVPHILSIDRISECICVQEVQIPGTPLSVKQTGFETYLWAALQIQTIPFGLPEQGFLLCGDDGLSLGDEVDWYHFFFSMVEKSVRRNKNLLRGDLPEFDSHYPALRKVFSDSAYRQPRKLVHGDLFPGNILVNQSGTVTGVIDFGSFTMFGDPLYDLATACIFFDMYGKNANEIRNMLLIKALDRISNDQKPWLYRYILGCALISCDLYQEANQPLANNGHYLWALEILKDEFLWNGIVNSP